MAMGGTAILLVVVMVGIGAEAVGLPKRDYCRGRKPSECCDGGRQDDCSVPIADSLCYCDHFCLPKDGEKSNHDDCCPDFREVCLGEKGPKEYYRPEEKAVCNYNGKVLQDGDSYTVNCNQCLCRNGRLECSKHQCLIDDEEIRRKKEVNPLLYGWRVANYSMFWGWKFEIALTLRTGTFAFNPETAKIPHISHDSKVIPSEFDARRKAGWGGLISGVRDQGWCGASWIFSTLAVVQDRHMILTGQHPVSLAPQEVLSCSSEKAYCNGGEIQRAWRYMSRHGAMVEECYQYESGTSRRVPLCHRDSRFITCKKYRTQHAYLITSTMQNIQWEIMTNGPVQALMRVHRDLFMYGQGVYQCPETDTGEATAMHSVRILGWGVDNTCMHSPVEYWLVANSWGTGWGEEGFFRIQRGTNECGIESSVIGMKGRQDSCI